MFPEKLTEQKIQNVCGVFCLPTLPISKDINWCFLIMLSYELSISIYCKWIDAATRFKL
jgi:hypothetical protein